MYRTSRSRLGLAAVWGVVATTLAVAQTVQPTTLQVDTIVSGLNGPTAMAFLGPDDILVTQKDDGRVRRVIAGVLQSSVVLDVNVNTFAERGLLGIALDPDFIHNAYVYLYYSEASGADDGPALGNRVYRYTWNGSALVTPQLVLDLPIDPGPNHDGGVILFGPDDRLYVVIGDLNHDGQLQNDPAGAAPDNTSVILRVDRSGRGPIDNPFYNPALPQSPLQRYYAYGVRNSFGLTFDPVTAALWDTENGPERMDEVNRVSPGFNSGWRPIMGPVALSGANESELWQAPGSAYSDPEFSWESTIAPTALAFVASKRLGCALEHRLLVGNVNCDSLQRFELDAARTGLAFGSAALQDLVANNPDTCADEQDEIAFGTGFGIVTDIENGLDGFVYVLSLSRGEIYRIRPQAADRGRPRRRPRAGRVRLRRRGSGRLGCAVCARAAPRVEGRRTAARLGRRLRDRRLRDNLRRGQRPPGRAPLLGQLQRRVYAGRRSRDTLDDGPARQPGARRRVLLPRACRQRLLLGHLRRFDAAPRPTRQPRRVVATGVQLAQRVLVPLRRVDRVPQRAQPLLALAHEALDALEDVLRGQVRLVDDLVDRAAGAPAVVPVGGQRVLGDDRVRDPVASSARSARLRDAPSRPSGRRREATALAVRRVLQRGRAAG